MGEEQKSWRVTLHRKALRELGRFPKPVVQRAWTAIEGLAVEPWPAGTRPVKGEEDTYRIRIGDYRIVYHIDAESLTILVLRVAHRKDVYRDL